MTIKGLSLWQPWASLLSIGSKKIETRSWSTPYRGLVAIHAAKKWDGGIKETIGRGEFWNVLYPTWPNRSPEDLPRGCFIAVGNLVDCLSTSENPKLIPSGHEFLYGDYSPGRYMWVFDEVWKLSSPVFARGYQALWTLEEGVKEVIIAMLPEEVEEREFGE